MTLTVSTQIRALFTDDGLDAIKRAIITGNQLCENMPGGAPLFWSFIPAARPGPYSAPSELKGRLNQVLDEMNTDTFCGLFFPIGSEDGPPPGTPWTHCRIFLHENHLWTAQELLDLGRDDVPGMTSTRRWAERVEQGWLYP